MAFFKIFLSAMTISLASAAGPAPAPYHAPAYPEVAPVYNFAYGVSDPHYGATFSHNENRENYNTAGEYRVNLPDGRVQIVTYKADEGGYVADVKYEGEAKYPEESYKPAYKPVHPAPYKPAPAPYKPVPAPAPYKPAPAYKPHPTPAYKPHPTPAYKPAPTYHPAPAYKPVHHPAPYHPAPYHPAPYHPAPAYHAAPTYHKKPTRYSFKAVTTAAPEPVEEEVSEEAAPAQEEAASDESAQ